MWPLLILSITNLSCIFERFSYWYRVKNIDRSQLNEIIEKYSNKNYSSNFKTNITKIPLEKVLRKTILMSVSWMWWCPTKMGSPLQRKFAKRTKMCRLSSWRQRRWKKMCWRTIKQNMIVCLLNWIHGAKRIARLIRRNPQRILWSIYPYSLCL